MRINFSFCSSVSAIIVVIRRQWFGFNDDFERRLLLTTNTRLIEMRCMNVRKDFFGRVEVCRAVEARISVQVEPLEEALEVGHDVPQPMLDEPIVLWKALSTSIALEWLSSADATKMSVEMRFVAERCRTVRTRMSNLQMNRIDVLLKTVLCRV